MTVNDLWEISPKSFLFICREDGAKIEYQRQAEFRGREVAEIRPASYPMYKSVIEVSLASESAAQEEIACVGGAYEGESVGQRAESARRTIGAELADAVLEEMGDLWASGVLDQFTCEEILENARRRIGSEECAHKEAD